MQDWSTAVPLSSISWNKILKDNPAIAFSKIGSTPPPSVSYQRQASTFHTQRRRYSFWRSSGNLFLRYQNGLLNGACILLPFSFHNLGRVCGAYVLYTCTMYTVQYFTLGKFSPSPLDISCSVFRVPLCWYLMLLLLENNPSFIKTSPSYREGEDVEQQGRIK